jgi:hypothetical protein
MNNKLSTEEVVLALCLALAWAAKVIIKDFVVPLIALLLTLAKWRPASQRPAAKADNAALPSVLTPEAERAICTAFQAAAAADRWQRVAKLKGANSAGTASSLREQLVSQ